MWCLCWHHVWFMIMDMGIEQSRFRQDRQRKYMEGAPKIMHLDRLRKEIDINSTKCIVIKIKTPEISGVFYFKVCFS